MTTVTSPPQAPTGPDGGKGKRDKPEKTGLLNKKISFSRSKKPAVPAEQAGHADDATPTQSVPVHSVSETRAALRLGGEARVDLLPQEVRARRASAIIVRRMGLALIGVILVVALLVGGATLLATQAKDNLTAAQTTTQSLLAQQLKYSDSQKVQKEIGVVKAGQSVAGYTQIEWLTFLAKVSETVPPNVAISTVSFTQATPLTPFAQSAVPLSGTRVATVTLIILSPTLPDLPPWLAALQTVPGVQDAVPGAVTLVSNSGSYTATVTLDLNESAFVHHQSTAKGK